MKGAYCFDLDDNFIIDDQIDSLPFDDMAFIDHINGFLSLERDISET